MQIMWTLSAFLANNNKYIAQVTDNIKMTNQFCIVTSIADSDITSLDTTNGPCKQ